jgi:glyoxylase-like metal-dependent hydrolase (beta-lactamase superfamily II)
VTHPDHARLAGAFAERWGNERFLPPEPRAHVLKGIARHDDGWPRATRAANHAAGQAQRVFRGAGRQIFAFEEIDLEDYLAVRDRAVR